MKTLKPLLNPTSVAVVGASEKPGSFGGQVMKNLIDYDFPGLVFGVHPKLEQVFARPCYRTLSDAPVAPDCVALAVANHQLLGVLEEAAGLGVKGAVVFGDPTVGAGRAPQLQAEIAALAEENQMVVCGPNAMGVYALHQRLAISGYPVDPALPAGRIALITASGTVFDALTQNNRGVAFGYVVSCGNEAVLSAADYLFHALNDPETSAVALYLETVRNPSAFVEALELAQARRTPIVALKVGLSEHGQAMAQAHTGALAGDAETYSALFERYGVSQVRSLDEMLDTVELLSHVPRVDGNRVSVLMESGGERSLVADLSHGLNIRFGQFDHHSKQKLEETLEDGVEVANPLDAFGSGHDVTRVYAECLEIMDQDPGTDLSVLAVDLVRDSYLSPMYVAAALAALPKLTKPLVTLVNLTAGANTDLMNELRNNAIPGLMGTETGLRALSHLNDFNEAHVFEPAIESARAGPADVSEIRASLLEAKEPLSEYEAKKVLSKFGLRITQELPANTLEVALEAAQHIGYPVAMKTAAPGVLHKSDLDGIRLHLGDDESLRHAYESISSRLGAPVLIQEMVSGGTEMLLGMKSDPQFGPIILIGMGGIFLEIYKDVVATFPVTDTNTIRKLLERLTGYPLLVGARGRPPADLDALTSTVAAFSNFVLTCGDLLSEVDVNPVLATAQGALALDALIIPH